MIESHWEFKKVDEESVIKLADTFADGEYYGITAIPKGCVHKVVSITQTSDMIEIF